MGAEVGRGVRSDWFDQIRLVGLSHFCGELSESFNEYTKYFDFSDSRHIAGFLFYIELANREGGII